MGRFGGILAAAAIALGVAAPSASAGAAVTATYVVDTVQDDSTLDACTAAADDCSLRGAIIKSNASSSDDRIHFAIPGAGPHTIQFNGGMEEITDQVTIDGYTQTGASE